jgi:hypothetical protein
MKRSIVVHPFLFAAFPILFSLANNMDQFLVRASLGPLLAMSGLVLVCWLLVGFVLRSWAKAGLIIALFLLLFFSYEGFYYEIRDYAVGAGLSRVGTRMSLVAAWVILFVAGTYWLARTRRDLLNLTNVANAISACAVGISLVNVGVYELRAGPELSGGTLASVIEDRQDLRPSTSLPDIYYIILDGYPSSGIAEEVYCYDNTPFLDHLTSMGFHVASDSRANYCQTAFSLASSLNMQYLDGLAERVGPNHQRLAPLLSLVHNSELVAFLKEHGYVTVAFATGWSITDIRGADSYMSPRWTPDEFQTAVLDMTPLPFVMGRMGGVDEYDLHRQRILYAFEHLSDFTQGEAPVFVFAHIMIPHPPFVFGPDGEETTPDYPYSLHDASSLIRKRRLTRDEYVAGYRDQLVFANSKVQSTLEAIISRSVEPPVIILQSDHGPGSLLNKEDLYGTYLKERMSILNAYYLPDGGDAQLYEEITPVNTFRVVLNAYFGTDLELLEDESYFSTWSHPYAFINVTDEMAAGVGGR